MALVLYGHPFSSYTQKVLVALYENATPFEFRCLGPETPQHSDEWLQRRPLRKFPLLADPVKRREAAAFSEDKLELAYAWCEEQLAGRIWAAGEHFSLADCAAGPALFYADWTHRIAERFPTVRSYRARLLGRPSFARAVDEARYFRPHFPLGAPDRD